MGNRKSVDVKTELDKNLISDLSSIVVEYHNPLRAAKIAIRDFLKSDGWKGTKSVYTKNKYTILITIFGDELSMSYTSSGARDIHYVAVDSKYKAIYQHSKGDGFKNNQTCHINDVVVVNDPFFKRLLQIGFA